eukprot:scaffold5172_cov73-Cylindrotheca_fusiformis.AAC.1
MVDALPLWRALPTPSQPNGVGLNERDHVFHLHGAEETRFIQIYSIKSRGAEHDSTAFRNSSM